MAAAVTRPLRRRRTYSIRSQVLLVQMATLVTTIFLGFVLVQWYQRSQLDQQLEVRALSIAESAAASSAIQNAISLGDPHQVIGTETRDIVHATGIAYAFALDTTGRTFASESAALARAEPLLSATGISGNSYLTGIPFTGLLATPAGTTAEAEAPIYAGGHRLVGAVATGISVSSLSDTISDSLPTLIAYMALILGVGATLALGLSGRLKRHIFGLELDEIASLYQEREAMLRGIREGVIGVDQEGKVTLVNEPARRLLRLPLVMHGRAINEVLQPGRLRDVVTGVIRGADQVIVIGDRVVVANRMPIRANLKGHLGWVITFQDRTESEALLRELDTVVGLTESLRAQSHEFSNRLHTLLGLMQLGRTDEAISFVADVASANNDLNTQLLEMIDSPTLTALLLGKSAVASEHGVALQVYTPDLVQIAPEALPDLLRVLGNLIDNAVDAAVEGLREDIAPYIDVQLASVGSTLEIEVTDSGGGIADDQANKIFDDGWSTKTSRTGARRGLGLSLVREIVERRGGVIRVENVVGASFRLSLPGVALSRGRSASPTREVP
jgi:two-component system CitB family sensor kinase